MRRDAREAEEARLESVCAGNCTEGSNPSLSAINISKGLGRARRGVSGALYLQSAIAGLNSCNEAFLFRVWLLQVTKTAGSCAMETYEPRQARKGAAVSRPFHVPRARLA
jgi:hypothetical protein